jgi:hypothetical protein
MTASGHFCSGAQALTNRRNRAAKPRAGKESRLVGAGLVGGSGVGIDVEC